MHYFQTQPDTIQKITDQATAIISKVKPFQEN